MFVFSWWLSISLLKNGVKKCLSECLEKFCFSRYVWVVWLGLFRSLWVGWVSSFVVSFVVMIWFFIVSVVVFRLLGSVVGLCRGLFISLVCLFFCCSIVEGLSCMRLRVL